MGIEVELSTQRKGVYEKWVLVAQRERQLEEVEEGE